MKFIKPSVEIITEPDLFKRIEIGARNCYLSYDKCGPGSDVDIFNKLVSRGHESALEHSNITVVCKGDSYAKYDIAMCIRRFELSGPMPTSYIKVSKDLYMFNGNLRAWRSVARMNKNENIIKYIASKIPGAFDDIFGGCPTSENEYDIKVYVNQIHDEWDTRLTARFTCDRAIQNELVRHRALSFSVTSTRYVNYKDGLTFVEPWWWPEQETSDTQFIRASCQAAEDAYCSLIASGASPQKARCVLPNMLKTEVVATGTVEQWQKLVLPLRLSKAAHPDIRRLMELFCEQLGWDPDDFRK